MDVDKLSFYPLFLDILEDLSTSYFVAFDLELSGVPTKKDRLKSKPGKPSINERYLEIKASAEKYHILQFGLTCVQEDHDSGKYFCQPYNFELSPLIDDNGLNIERDFTYSSSAVSFLQSTSFSFGNAFNVGIQYLNAEETSQARRNFESRQSRDGIVDMEIKDTDTEALALLKTSRRAIDQWLKQSPNGKYINLGPPGFDKFREDLEPLPEYSRFEKRLIHQLVRSEYPKLVSNSKRGFVQVEHLNEKREAKFLADRKSDYEARLSKQKGFSWVMDALLGKDISAFDLSRCGFDPIYGNAIAFDMDEFKARFENATHQLRSRPRIVAGHNCFLDLIYIYHHFVGPLPDTVEGFVEAIHDLWPVIIDTKYMATHNCGDINPTSSLEEIARQLQPKSGEAAMDEVDEDHSKYLNTTPFHEAGFDSLLTAQIAVRLSRKLERDGAYLADLDTDTGGVSLAGTGSLHTVIDKSKDVLTATLSKIGISGPIKQLTSMTDGAASPRAKPGPPHEHGGDLPNGMPAFGSSFWRVYGNNLRVFGTEEGLLSLQHL